MEEIQINQIILYSNDFLTIIEDRITKIFRIKFLYPNPILINSLIKTNLIQGATIRDDYKLIKFKALSIKTFKQFQEEQKRKNGTPTLPINIVASLISNLATQLNYLITYQNHTIIGYNPENTIVINDSKFAFLGRDLITEINNNEEILISYPYKTSDFYVSPELLKITKLPTYTHYKTSYFSLSCLALYALLSDNHFYNEYLDSKDSENILNNLKNHPIKNTKLYWLLSRCLVEDPKSRCILYI
jgi:serine/threonine protein kinase